MTVSEAATALGVSSSTVRRRITSGRLDARREPHRNAFRWLVLMPEVGTAPTAVEVVAAPAEVIPTVEERREEPSEVRAGTAPAPVPEAEGSRWALLLSVAVLLGAVLLSVLSLPGWTAGIIGSVAVVAGLIAVVEVYLAVSGWVGMRQERAS